MIAVDIGNSTVQFARFSKEAGAEPVGHTRLLTSALEESAIIRALTALGCPEGWYRRHEDDARVWIASVVPDAAATLTATLHRLGWRHPVVLDPQRHTILPHDLETPQTTGVDRLLAARAALARAETDAPGRGVIVIQAGTAIPVDVVDATGCFRGGMILPGPQMWLDGLARAAQIPSLSPGDADWQPDGGRDTRAALLKGLSTGLPGAIDAAVAVLRGIASDAPVYITGGWSHALAPVLGCVPVRMPGLVLQGIRLVGQDH